MKAVLFHEHGNVDVLHVEEVPQPTPGSLIGSYGGTRQDLADVLKLVATGQLKPIVHGIYTLEQLGTAQQLMESREQFGKLVITPSL